MPGSEKGPNIWRQGEIAAPEPGAPDGPSAPAHVVRGPGQGESETIIACKRAQRQGRAYCILDDRPARAGAQRQGVPLAGVLGLLRMLKDRGIVEGGEVSEIVAELRRSGFRLPGNIDI